MPPGDKDTQTSAEEERRAEQQMTLWGQLQRASRNLIHAVMMRGGGEPFGAPFEAGTPSLTEKAVQQFKQRSFFSFETLERLRLRRQRNKFTRHGAAPFRGPYQVAVQVRENRGAVNRILDYLRENRFFIFGPRPPDPRPHGRPRQRPKQG